MTARGAAVLLLGAALVWLAASPADGDEPPAWDEILGVAHGGKWPKPLPRVVWRERLGKAMAEAQRTNRPLFVAFRCPPCKQCATFDQQVMAGGPLLDPLLKQFVTVRITTMEGIDFRLFPVERFQDLDLSWWGWFLSPEGRVYGVFGGRDEVSDATRISKPALAAALGRVLSHHYDPRRARWQIDGPAPVLQGPKRTPKKLPGWRSWRKKTKGHVDCLHCHQIAEVLRQPDVDAGTFNKQRGFEMWPLPENVGLELDRDDGLSVKAVRPKSAAARAGLKAGDVLGAAGGRRLFSQTDFRGALHRGPAGKGRIEVWWTRGGKPSRGLLEVEDGWRSTVLDWRMSVSQGNVGAYPGFWPLGGGQATMAIKPYFGRRPSGAAWDAGLRPRHVVLAVDGQSPALSGRAFLVWFRLRYDPGDKITLTIRDRDGKTKTVRYRLRS